jgi:hypothetical protein
MIRAERTWPKGRQRSKQRIVNFRDRNSRTSRARRNVLRNGRNPAQKLRTRRSVFGTRNRIGQATLRLPARFARSAPAGSQLAKNSFVGRCSTA